MNNVTHDTKVHISVDIEMRGIIITHMDAHVSEHLTNVESY